MRKSIVFWLTFVLALGIALYFAVRISMTVMGMGNVSRVSKISVKSDLGADYADEIASVLMLPTGKSVYSINLDAYLEKMIGLPDISDAAIRRTPSGKILIRANTRKIVAVWTDGVNFYPLAADGRHIGRTLDTVPQNTLVFSGELPDDIAVFAETLRANSVISKTIGRIEWCDGRRWNIYTTNDIKIMLPENNFDSALGKLAKLQKQSEILSRNVSVIDLRDPERTLIKM